MPVALGLRNESARRQPVRRDRLAALAQRVLDGESVSGDVEVSVLLCDDPAIAELNRRYGGEPGPTDVLSFEQPDGAAASPRLLGDIVISLETAERNCGGDAALLRSEVELLFCHGLLHLLGLDHHREQDRAVMQARQAQYLGVSEGAAWNFGAKSPAARRAVATHGGSRRVGR